MTNGILRRKHSSQDRGETCKTYAQVMGVVYTRHESKFTSTRRGNTRRRRNSFAQQLSAWKGAVYVYTTTTTTNNNNNSSSNNGTVNGPVNYTPRPR